MKVAQHKVLIGLLIASLGSVTILNNNLVQNIAPRSSSMEMHPWNASEWITCLQSAADNQVDGMIRSRMNNLYQLSGSKEHNISSELLAGMKRVAGNLDYEGVTEKTTLLYVGGNEVAAVARRMIDRFHFWKTYILEPIPSFVQNLQANMQIVVHK